MGVAWPGPGGHMVRTLGLCRATLAAVDGAGGRPDDPAHGGAPRKKSVRHVPLRGKNVLVRVDFNVPLRSVAEGPAGTAGVTAASASPAAAVADRVDDDTRLRAAVPTIRHLLEGGARVVLCSHLGRPQGRPDPRLSLRQVVPLLEVLTQAPVVFSPVTVGAEALEAVRRAAPGSVVLLENTRFHPGEEKNDPELARALAALGELFVNDAFGAAHRAHASTVGVARHLPAVAGLLLQRELDALSRLLTPERPFVAIVGGAKVADKLGVLHEIVGQADRLLVGGGMANTFLAASGLSVGRSLVERDLLPAASDLLRAAAARGVQVLLPVDLVVGGAFRPDTPARVVAAGAVPAEAMALDIGPETVAMFARALVGARTVFWNGPLGVSEWPAFAAGTAGVADAVASCQGFTVVGGGDSIAALRRLGRLEAIGHVSTGGGASLEFLEGRSLPGVACLEDQ